jgi:replication factor C large subunit
MRSAIIVHGAPGSGKTTWIYQEAKRNAYKLFRWNVRNDRSLREGREVLHSQVRSQEKTMVWIEGADDLTQEAQAFLRRILDTRSKDVQCVLETREPWKLSAPVLSRCSFVSFSVPISYRRQILEGKAKESGLLLSHSNLFVPRKFSDIQRLRKEGADPKEVLKLLLKEPGRDNEKKEALRRVGAGSSPWLQIAWIVSLDASE